MSMVNKATNKPGRPTKIKTHCQPDKKLTPNKEMLPTLFPVTKEITEPPIISASPAPIAVPILKIPIARPNLFGGKLSASIEYAAGPSVASPTPTPILARKSCV